MRILITGSTGYVGKYLVAQILSATSHTLVLPIRSKKGLTPQDRFQKEFCSYTLFGTDRLQTALQTRVTVLEGVVGAGDLSGVDCVIHNAANVSFFERFEILKQDNVDGVERIARLVQACQTVSRFLYISTCYVHPKDGTPGASGKSELLPPDLSQDRFINPYAYSKYLAEGVLTNTLTRISPEILRLSIVGAPLGYFSAHPARGAAHLSILQAIFENRLPYVWIPNSVRLNILPVDCIVDQILTHLEASAAPAAPGKPVVKQLCAPPENPAYHLSLKDMSTFLTTKYKHLLSNTVLSTVEGYEDFCASVKGIVKIPNVVDLLQKANKVIHCVEHTPWFECSIPPSALPDISAEKHIQLTCAFVLRGIHERKIKTGVALSNSDQIMRCLENRTVSAEITLPSIFEKLSTEDRLERLYHAAWVDRKNLAELDTQKGLWLPRKARLSQSAVAVLAHAKTNEEARLWAYQHPIPSNVGYRFILFQDTDKFISCISQMNHFYMDGIGILLHTEGILESLSREIGDFDSGAGAQRAPKELSLWEDIWIGLKYGGWLVLDCIKQAWAERPSAGQISIASFETPTKSVPLGHGMSFTESYARDLIESTGTSSPSKDKGTVRLCIPANTQSPLTRMKEPSQNHTALFYKGFEKGQSPAEFKESFKVFRSMTAKWIALVLGGLLASWLPWLLKKCIDSVDLIFSSINMPFCPKDLEGKILMPVQERQKMGACALTMEDTTYHCITSRGPEGSAKEIEKSLREIWAERTKKL